MTFFGTQKFRLPVAWIVIVSMAVLSAPMRADDGPTPLDPSNPYLNVLKLAQSLLQFGSLDLNTQVLLASLVVTLKSYLAFKAALNDWRAQRDGAKAKLATVAEQQVDFREKSKLLTRLLQEWDVVEAEARQALLDLKLISQQLPKSETQWNDWSVSEAGLLWQEKVKNLSRVLMEKHGPLYDQLVKAASIPFPQTQPITTPEFYDPNRPLAESSSLETLMRHELNLNRMNYQVSSLRGQCSLEISKFAQKNSVAEAEAKTFSHMGKRVPVWGGLTTVSGVTAYLSYRKYQKEFGKDPIQLSFENAKSMEANRQAELDLCGQVASEKGRKELEKTFGIFVRVLNRHRPQIMADFKDRLNQLDKQILSSRGYTVESLLNQLNDPQHIRFAFEKSFCLTGKRQIGERASITQSLNYLYSDDKVVRENERPDFVHELWIGFFNNLWSPLKRTGGGANRITDPTIFDLEATMLKALEGSDITAPPSPPAP